MVDRNDEVRTWLLESYIASIDLFSLIAGKLIGTGAYRNVYECKLNPDWVLKVETCPGKFANQLEWETWDWCNRFHPHIAEKWLAPCLYISDCGSFMIQAKTTKADLKEYPKKVPAFLNNDIKESNWGLYKNHIVCHDYGNIRFTAGNRLEKVKWWD